MANNSGDVLLGERLIDLKATFDTRCRRLSRVIRVRYEGGVLKPLEPVELREGEEVVVRIVEGVRERLKDLIGVLGESSDEELERYLEEAWQT